MVGSGDVIAQEGSAEEEENKLLLIVVQGTVTVEKYGTVFEEHRAPYCIGELVVIDRRETYMATYRAKTQLFIRTLQS